MPPRNQKLVVLPVLGQVALVALFSGIPFAVETVSRSIWDGVYTEEQAKRGQDTYLDECSSCHAVNLLGDESAKALLGDEFMAGWNGKTVGDLFERTRATMPKDGPGRLAPQQYADVIAFLLKSNNLPSGSAPLDREADLLKQIRWEIKPPSKP